MNNLILEIKGSRPFENWNMEKDSKSILKDYMNNEYKK